jgi:hypothetical protein
VTCPGWLLHEFGWHHVFATRRECNGTRCCVIQRRDHNARRRTVMIIESATGLAFAAGCLTAILTLPTAHAQMGGAPGGYWPPGAYGYGPPPGAYGYGPPSGAYGYSPPPSPYGYAPPTGAYGSPPGAYAPQSQYVPTPPSAGTAGTQLITNGPQTSPGDVSSAWSTTQRQGEPTVRPAATGKPGIPPGPYAQGVRPNYRSATSSAVPRQLCSVLTLSQSSDRVWQYA